MMFDNEIKKIQEQIEKEPLLLQVWDKKEQIMRNVEMIRISKVGYLLGVKMWESKVGGEKPFEFIDVWDNENRNRFVLRKGINLKDKNGKDVFVGDIVFDKILQQKGVIMFSDKNKEFVFLSIWSGREYIIHNSFEKDYEIVGNIFENPEIMKGDINEKNL